MTTTIPAALTAASLGMPAARADEPRKIVFVDTGNTGRSVTAEALAAADVRDRYLPVAVLGRGVDVDPFDVAPSPPPPPCCSNTASTCRATAPPRSSP